MEGLLADSGGFFGFIVIIIMSYLQCSYYNMNIGAFRESVLSKDKIMCFQLVKWCEPSLKDLCTRWQVQVSKKTSLPQSLQQQLRPIKSFLSHKGPQGGTDLRFCSPQPDTSRSCKSTDMGQCVAWSACLAHSLCRYQFVLLAEQRHVYMNNLLCGVDLSVASLTTTSQ